MTALTILVPDNKAIDLLEYAKKLGGEIVAEIKKEPANSQADHEIAQFLSETDLNTISLAFAEKAFSEDWDINDHEANAYWDSL